MSGLQPRGAWVGEGGVPGVRRAVCVGGGLAGGDAAERAGFGVLESLDAAARGSAVPALQLYGVRREGHALSGVRQGF